MLACLPATGHAEYGQIAALLGSDDAPVVMQENKLPWHLDRIHAENAWQQSAIGKNVTVAVLDTGIDETHEKLAGKIIKSVNFTTSKTTGDVNGHGTAIAGIIAAAFDDFGNAVGVAYQSDILNVKVARDDGFVIPDRLADGIRWAADNGADIINLSITLGAPHESVEAAIAYAWEKGCVIVAAAGNSGGVKPVYPAAYPGVISVAATDTDDNLTRWSNRGDWINISAPGTNILSTTPQNKYIYKTGTSFAVPLVSGGAALIFTRVEDANGNGRVNDEVKDALAKDTRGTDDIRTITRLNLAGIVTSLTRSK